MPDIEHSRECGECGEGAYQYGRCRECGCIPWGVP